MTHQSSHFNSPANKFTSPNCWAGALTFPLSVWLHEDVTFCLRRCSECQKTFQYPSQLQNHMMKHKDIRPYICSECGMEFIQSHHLKQHTLTHKVGSRRRTNACVSVCFDRGWKREYGSWASNSDDSLSHCFAQTVMADVPPPKKISAVVHLLELLIVSCHLLFPPE